MFLFLMPSKMSIIFFLLQKSIPKNIGTKKVGIEISSDFLKSLLRILFGIK